MSGTRGARRLWTRGRATVIALGLSGCGGAAGPPTQPPPVPPPVPPAAGAVHAWVTTGDQSRVLSQDPDLTFGTGTPAASTVIDVDASVRYQQMLGFGAAVTDASAYLIQEKMSAAQRAGLLQDLFGRAPGIGLSFVRVPMGASDFSLRQYSYDDVPLGQTDPTLTHFSVAPDRADKLPVLRAALALNPKLRVMATPWSPPGWMKSSGSLIQGTLLPSAYAPFAQYFVRFIQAYAAEGVPVYAITVQNEPAFEPKDYPGMLLPPAERARVIGGYVGPALARAGLATRIWDWDHNWDQPQSPGTVLADSTARRFVDGVAWHCYAGNVAAQTTVHDQYPGKGTYFTECSGGDWSPDFATDLKYFVGTLIIGTTRNWARSVALWNLALDEHDGPHTGGCGNCRGVVTINSATGVYQRNVEYFALAHASEFVRPGADRIASSSDVNGLQSTAFRNADDGSTVLIVLNTAAAERPFAVRANGASFSYVLPAASVVTFEWR